MKTLTELIIGVSGLFSIGVAGGLERGYIGIGGAFIAWGCATAVIAIATKVNRSIRGEEEK